LQLSAHIFSQRPEESSGVVTPEFTALQPFHGPDATLFFSGGEDLRFENFNVVIHNNVEVKYTLSGKRWCSGHVVHGFSIGGSFTLEFETEAERRKMWGGVTATGPRKVVAPIHLSMILTHPAEIEPGHNYYLKLDVPEVYIESAPAGIRRLSDRILQTINFKPVYSRAHDKYADLIIRNGVESYPDPA
jgi:hypothetical protein